MEQQNQQPIQEKAENKPPTKTNWRYIAIVVVLGSIVGGGIVWYASSPIPESPVVRTQIQKAPTPKQEAQKPVELKLQGDTSTWQTYRNDEFGFEVKYPKEWSIIGEAMNQPAFTLDGKVKIYTRLHVSGTQEYIYSLAYREEQECPEKIFEPGEPMIAPGAACPLVKPKETKEININGINGYLKERESGSLSAYLPRSDKKIAIELATRYSDYKDVFNQILSTFRFVP